AEISFSPTGQGTVVMDIERVEALDPTNFYLHSGTAHPADYRRQGSTNPCASLTIHTSDGTFSANERVLLQRLSLGGTNQQVQLNPVRSAFVANGNRTAKYWVLPLSNFVPDQWPSPLIYPELAGHPLRVQHPGPASSSQCDQQAAESDSNH